MARSEKPWEPEWSRGDSIGEGGQGKTFRARRKSDPHDVWGFVLKQIKNEGRPDSRHRIALEAATLRHLDHLGVARLVGSNTEDYKEDVPLYLVTDFVPGLDLDDFRATREPSLPEAAQLVIRLLETLRDCHKLGVLHRDIKPDNIILRNGEHASPILIDFGLTFGHELDADHSTETDQAMGNRFIILPEQWGDSAAKRDPVSDLTQVVGIFHFLLFNKYPGNLAHAQYLKPHERFPWREQLRTLEKWQLDQLALIFNTGFEIDPVQRWPSADRLISELEILLADSPPPPVATPIAERLQLLKAHATKAQGNQQTLKLGQIAKDVHQAVILFCLKLSHDEDLRQLVRVGQGPNGFTPATRRFFFGVSVQSVLNDRPHYHLKYELNLIGDQLALTRSIAEFRGMFGVPAPDLNLAELLTVRVNDPRARELLQARVEDDVQEFVAVELRD
jgi:serine/threonine protein kinase